MRTKRLVAIGALMILVVGAGPARSEPSSSPSEGSRADGLRVSQASATKLRATYGHSTTAITLTSSSSRTGSARSQIDVNGKTITATRDLVSGTARWAGGGSALTPAEHAGLQSLAAKVSTEWAAPAKAANRALPTHTDLMLRLVMLAAEAPPGVKLVSYRANRPAMTMETATDFTRTERQSSTCIESALERTADKSAERQQALAACQRSDEEGIFYMACVRANRPLNHDAGSHCFLEESINSGPGSSDCMGECGPGCNGIDTFTYDCGDHDRCGRVHGGSLNPWDSECGDEYFEADDDTLWAPINRC